MRRVDVAEFRSLGLVQETNRRMLHPLGMALEVTVAEEPGAMLLLSDADLAALRLAADLLKDRAPRGSPRYQAGERIEAALGRGARVSPGSEWLSGVWDCRDDPEGLRFGPDLDGDAAGAFRERRDRVDRLWADREDERVAALGYMVQPL